MPGKYVFLATCKVCSGETIVFGTPFCVRQRLEKNPGLECAIMERIGFCRAKNSLSQEGESVAAARRLVGPLLTSFQRVYICFEQLASEFQPHERTPKANTVGSVKFLGRVLVSPGWQFAFPVRRCIALTFGSLPGKSLRLPTGATDKSSRLRALLGFAFFGFPPSWLSRRTGLGVEDLGRGGLGAGIPIGRGGGWTLPAYPLNPPRGNTQWHLTR